MAEPQAPPSRRLNPPWLLFLPVLAPRPPSQVVDQGGRYWSEADGKFVEKPEHRYVLSCRVVDFTGQAYVQLFNKEVRAHACICICPSACAQWRRVCACVGVHAQVCTHARASLIIECPRHPGLPPGLEGASGAYAVCTRVGTHSCTS